MPEVSVRQRGDQFRRLARSALTDLFDQRRPFGRLALTHVLMTAGDTLFAVSLAGSLFFSISPGAAKDKVILYLLLTMAPFAVVAPALGPLIDRSRGARRAMVVTSALGRALLCPFVARDIHSLLLFPEAFLMLVLSKVYLVTKGAIVPEIAALDMAVPGLARSTTEAPAPSSDSSFPGASGPSPGQPPAALPGAPDPVTGAASARTPPYGTPIVRVEDPVTGVEIDRAGPGHPERPARSPGLAGRVRRRLTGRRSSTSSVARRRSCGPMWLSSVAQWRPVSGCRCVAVAGDVRTPTFRPLFVLGGHRLGPGSGNRRPLGRRRRRPRRRCARWPTPR